MSHSPWYENVLQDARYAIRGLRRSPGFTITVILTLGLGIGANTAMFGIIDRLMFKPFPYMRDQDAVHRVYTASTHRDSRSWNGVSQYTTSLDFRKWTTTFSQYAGFASQMMAVGSGQDSRERRVGMVNASFFDFFDAKPALGRWFVAAEDSVPVGADVSVISYDMWQNDFGGRNVIGEKLAIWNRTTEIIGVAPKGFVGVFDASPPDAYIPITTYAGNGPNTRDKTEYYTTYSWGWMDMMVRRKPGVTLEAANADLTQAFVKSYQAQLVSQGAGTPVEAAKPGAAAGSLKTAAGPEPTVEARTVRWVSGIALIVLLIACSNVANLFLSRALKRRRETAVRIALGGGRGRLMAQWFTESLVLALIGCVAGVLIAQWGGAAIRQLFVGTGAPIAVATDWRTLGLSAALAIVAAILTGIAPALVAGRGGAAGDLKAGAREGNRRSRLRNGLLIVQVTMSVVLLVGAGLFVRSFANVKALRLGYDFDQAVLISRNMRGATVADSSLITLQRRILEVAQAHPDVEYAALASSVPFWSTSSTNLYVTGIDSVRKLGQFTFQTATPDYFKAMGTRIIRGRPFDATDRLGSPRVAVVSEAMANVLWPGTEALGQCIRVGGGGQDTMPCTNVIGIAENAAQNDLSASDQRFRYYLPLDQAISSARGSYLLTRVRGNPGAVGESVRKAVQQVMPGDSYVTTRPLSELISARQRAWRFGATMFLAFGVLALVVAGIGLYGVIGYDVAQRMHELGVRIALGAQSGDLIRLVMKQAVQVAVIGIVIGSGIALALSSRIEPLLFKQSARDPLVISGVAIVLFLSAVAACFAPAMRASRADPNTALRSD